jgi:hypothetical protein
MKKGVESEAGSISQRYGSGDPDLHQNVNGSPTLAPGLRAGLLQHADLRARVAGLREHGRHLVQEAGGDRRHAPLQLTDLLRAGQQGPDQGGG